TRADVSQLTGGPRIVQVIELDQGHTGSAVTATDNGGIESGIQRLYNGRLQVIPRIERGVDEQLLICGTIVLPVVVCRYDESGGVMHLQEWVGEGSSDAHGGQGWSDRTNDDQFGISAINDETANSHIGASFHVHSSREVESLVWGSRRWARARACAR